MNRPLAILAPSIGDVHETFVRRHMSDLAPGRTVVVAATRDKPDCGHWDVDCPVLVLDRIERDYAAAIDRFLRQHAVRVMLGEYLDYSLPFIETAARLKIRLFGHAHGYDVSAHPASSADNGYTISAFDVNNPWPPTPDAAAEPPHTNTDGCGTGTPEIHTAQFHIYCYYDTSCANCVRF